MKNHTVCLPLPEVRQGKISQEEAKELALSSEKVKARTGGKRIVKAVYVPGRLVNVVVK